jgi:hypothetical protein
MKQVSIQLPEIFVERLQAEAKRVNRPVSFVPRKWLLIVDMVRAVDRAESIDDIICHPPAA